MNVPVSNMNDFIEKYLYYSNNIKIKKTNKFHPLSRRFCDKAYILQPWEESFHSYSIPFFLSSLHCSQVPAQDQSIFLSLHLLLLLRPTYLGVRNLSPLSRIASKSSFSSKLNPSFLALSLFDSSNKTGRFSFSQVFNFVFCV